MFDPVPMPSEEWCNFKGEGKDIAKQQSRSNQLYHLDPLPIEVQTPARTVRELDAPLVCIGMEPFLAFHFLDPTTELWNGNGKELNDEVGDVEHIWASNPIWAIREGSQGSSVSFARIARWPPNQTRRTADITTLSEWLLYL
jgi:hypothetical protein